jgi:N-acetyl-anhydromuramyl-L-alanine amidase AmpD
MKSLKEFFCKNEYLEKITASKKHSYQPRIDPENIKYIMQHHNQLPSAAAAYEFFADHGNFPHYAIEPNGDIFKFIEPNNIALHANEGKIAVNIKDYPQYPAPSHINNVSLAIMHLASLPFGWISDEQTKSAALLCDNFITLHPSINRNTGIIAAHQWSWGTPGAVDPLSFLHFPNQAFAQAEEIFGTKYNLGLYPKNEEDYKQNPNILLSIDSPQEEFNYTRDTLNELGYAFAQNESSDKAAQYQELEKAIKSFSIKYMNNYITNQIEGLGLSSESNPDTFSAQTDIIGLCSIWTENHEHAAADILDQLSQ